jgi:hypothetical protein
VQNEIPVDLGTLCKFLERLCVLLILFRTDARKRNLHGVTLPHSWIIRKDFNRFRGTNTQSYQLLPGMIRILLTRLWKMNTSDQGYCSNVSLISEAQGPWFYYLKDIPGDNLDEVRM